MVYSSSMMTKVTADALIDGLSTVIMGKRDQLELFVTAYLSGGHVLLEDVPGLGKTTLAKALARLIGSGSGKKPSRFKRIQFTPDLLPNDITGVDTFNPLKQSFDFMPGPIFCDILLADEINRTTPKVQSALLEVMAERQVTTGGATRSIGPSFFVVATQNPVESEGTYPLPAAQLDRFMLRISLGYPDESAELSVMHNDPSETVLPTLKPIVGKNVVESIKKESAAVFCHPALERSILSIVRKTREHPAILLGVSPRGALHLLHAARTLALMRGRDWIEADDVHDLSVPVLAHRIIGKKSGTDLNGIVKAIAVEVLRDLEKTTDWSKKPTDGYAKAR